MTYVRTRAGGPLGSGTEAKAEAKEKFWTEAEPKPKKYVRSKTEGEALQNVHRTRSENI